MQHLNVMCELWSEYKLVGIYFLLKTGTHDLHWRWGHKFAIKALLCNTQYFYRGDSDMSLNNTQRMYSFISSAKWLRERAKRYVICTLLILLYAECFFSPWLYVIFLHSSHDRSNWTSPSFSSITFQNIPGIFYLLSEMSEVQHHTKLCSNFTSFFLKLKSNMLNFASVLAVLDWWYREITAVCYEIHKEHIHNMDRM
jgi:hypothetical protein